MTARPLLVCCQRRSHAEWARCLASLASPVVDGATVQLSALAPVDDDPVMTALLAARGRPDQWLRFAMPANDLDPAASYPFKTVQMQTAYDGRAAQAMTVPIITDPAFQDWLVARWAARIDWLDEQGLTDSLLSVEVAVTAQASYDSEQALPLPAGCTDGAAYWAGLGVTQDGYLAALAAIAGRVSALVPGKYVTLSVLDPHHANLDRAHDGGAFYNLLIDAVAAQVKAAGAVPVVVDLAIGSNTPRQLIQLAADRVGGFMGQTVPNAEPTASYVAAARANLGLNPNARWDEVQGNLVPFIEAVGAPGLAA